MSPRRAPLAAVGVAVVVACAAGGCRAAAMPGAPESRRAPQPVRLPSGLTMSPALAILDLEQNARYRWATPDSLVRGLTTEDAESVTSPRVLALSEPVGTVLRANGWRAVPDSAAYELAMFTVARTVMRREERTEYFQNPDSRLPRCDASLGSKQPRCTTAAPPTTRSVLVNVPQTERWVFLILRRRSDGATRVWVNSETVARDLMRLFTAGDAASTARSPRSP